MTHPDPAEEARIRTARFSMPLDQVAGDPMFKSGFADGRDGKPLASYSRLYLVGYHEGAIRAPARLVEAEPLLEG